MPIFNQREYQTMILAAMLRDVRPISYRGCDEGCFEFLHVEF